MIDHVVTGFDLQSLLEFLPFDGSLDFGFPPMKKYFSDMVQVFAVGLEKRFQNLFRANQFKTLWQACGWKLPRVHCQIMIPKIAANHTLEERLLDAICFGLS